MSKMKLLAAVTLIAMSGACATPQPAAAPIARASSLCLIDEPIYGEVAPAEDYDDLGNRYDTDGTIEKLELHNERLRAACSDE